MIVIAITIGLSVLSTVFVFLLGFFIGQAKEQEKWESSLDQLDDKVIILSKEKFNELEQLSRKLRREKTKREGSIYQ